jgi:hypothetical protein
MLIFRMSVQARRSGAHGWSKHLQSFNLPRMQSNNVFAVQRPRGMAALASLVYPASTLARASSRGDAVLG